MRCQVSVEEAVQPVRIKAAVTGEALKRWPPPGAAKERVAVSNLFLRKTEIRPTATADSERKHLVSDTRTEPVQEEPLTFQIPSTEYQIPTFSTTEL